MAAAYGSVASISYPVSYTQHTASFFVLPSVFNGFLMGSAGWYRAQPNSTRFSRFYFCFYKAGIVAR